MLALTIAPVRAESPDGEEAPQWTTQLTTRLAQIDANYPGELGVYVKDLSSGEVVGLRDMEPWYLASTVKVAVAITLLEEVDAGRTSLNERIVLEPLDYVDGAGETNWQEPGTAVTLQYLFDQMLIHSDNTATDVLLRYLGTDTVNAMVRRVVGLGVGRITTLADVRRYAYSEFHPDAMHLAPKGLFAIRASGYGEDRVAALVQVLGVPRAEFNAPDLDAAFDRYYATGLNSAPLDQYSELWEAVARGDLLSPASATLLLSTLERIETGDDRIKAGLPSSVSFAHKTGTQHRRACNIGLATTPGQAPDEGVIIAACTRGSLNLSEAEAAFRALGEAVAESGVFAPES
ncbi:serine hydrolase [Saccharospirillum sp. MSK14-1]|uniref:serine hydrolase n=1 Tax=Saccharospirillum sp. MSK14-1 TaxID=1897632 RepID=UPI001304DF51|nr:serine hydrolase [Saccharospirillum sp. MSK14-1]